MVELEFVNLVLKALGFPQYPPVVGSEFIFYLWSSYSWSMHWSLIFSKTSPSAAPYEMLAAGVR